MAILGHRENEALNPAALISRPLITAELFEPLQECVALSELMPSHVHFEPEAAFFVGLGRSRTLSRLCRTFKRLPLVGWRDQQHEPHPRTRTRLIVTHVPPASVRHLTKREQRGATK